MSLDPRLLLEMRAALQAGASPAAALAVARHGPLAAAGAAARVGRPLAEVAADAATGDHHADLLVRALALAERVGAGAVDAVEQVLAAADEDQRLERLLRARTAQARLSVTVLSATPLVLWVVLVATDPAVLRFYGTALGALTALVALSLGGAGLAWARRIAGAAARAPDGADPLAAPREGFDTRRALAVAVPVLLVAWPMAGGLVGLPSAAAAGVLAGRPGRSGRRGQAAGGAAETLELVAAAMHAGLDPQAALAAVVPLAPEAAREPLSQALARLRAGWDVGDALEGTPLADAGAVLSSSHRWGAPAHPALRRLAAELRARRSAAADEAAERVQVFLIFPTTLLTLPAFVLAVVPPLVWSAFLG